MRKIKLLVEVEIPGEIGRMVWIGVSNAGTEGIEPHKVLATYGHLVLLNMLQVPPAHVSAEEFDLISKIISQAIVQAAAKATREPDPKKDST